MIFLVWVFISLQKCSNKIAGVWSFLFLLLIGVGKLEEELKMLRPHGEATAMLLFETPKKASFDADVLTMAEHMLTRSM